MVPAELFSRCRNLSAEAKFIEIKIYTAKASRVWASNRVLNSKLPKEKTLLLVKRSSCKQACMLLTEVIALGTVNPEEEHADESYLLFGVGLSLSSLLIPTTDDKPPDVVVNSGHAVVSLV